MSEQKKNKGSELIPICSPTDINEVAVIKSRLEGAGINYSIEGENLNNLYGPLKVVPFSVLVHKTEAKRAEQILSDFIKPSKQYDAEGRKEAWNKSKPVLLKLILVFLAFGLGAYFMPRLVANSNYKQADFKKIVAGNITHWEDMEPTNNNAGPLIQIHIEYRVLELGLHKSFSEIVARDLLGSDAITGRKVKILIFSKDNKYQALSEFNPDFPKL